MNILLFVTSIMFVLSALTYSRIEHFFTVRTMHRQFNFYMETAERAHISSVAEKLHRNAVVSSRSGGSQKNPKGPLSSGRINFKAFIDPEYQTAHPDETLLMKALIQKLIFNLYGKQPFFQEFIKDKADPFNQLWLNVMAASNRLEKDEKIKKTEDLGNLRLENEEMEKFFYLILKGTRQRDGGKKISLLESDHKKEHEDGKEEETEEENEGGCDNYVSPQGYHSLLDFITLKGNPNIRVYLASTEILEAIFEDKSTVEKVLNEREMIFKTLRNKDLDKAEEIKKFKADFELKADHQLAHILDWDVTKTDPSKYR